MHKRLPKGFQRSEFLLEHGFCDAVVPRGEIALTVGELLALHEGHAPGLGAPHEIVHTGRRGKKLGHLFKRSAAPKPRSRLSSRPARQIAPRQAR